MAWDPFEAKDFHLRVTSAHLPDSFNTVAWSPDGGSLASGSDDNTVRIWDPATGKLLRTLEGHSARVWSVSWSSDGKALASGSADKTVRIWDPATGKLLRTLEGHFDTVFSTSWSSDSEALASGAADKTVRIWDPATGKLLRTLEGHSDAVFSVSWFDGKALASGACDRTVRIWDPATGKLLRTLEGHSAQVLSVTWSSDGKALASGSDDKTVCVWDPFTGKLLRTLEGHSAEVLSVTWSSDGKALASGSDDKTVRIWDPATGKLLRTLEGHSDTVWSVGWSWNNEALASGSDDKTVRIWDPATGMVLRTLKGCSAQVLSVSWSSDGKALASGSSDNTVRIWDPATGMVLRTLKGHSAQVLSVSWSSDDKALASGSSDNTVRIWDPATGNLLRTLEGHSAAVFAVRWSSDGKALASGSSDRTVRIWDPVTGNLLRTLEGHSSQVLSVSWSSDSKALASGSDDQTVRIWDPTTGKLLRTLEGHSDRVWSVSWSSNGKALASGSDDQTVRIWDPATGDPLGVLKCVFRPTHSMCDLAFRPKATISTSYQDSHRSDPDLMVIAIESLATVAPSEATTQVACAKIVLVGESNVGKSYLAHRIATGHPPDAGTIKSTHGMKFWPLPPDRLCGDAAPAGQRRDIVLWDMGGQEEYRLVHQLFLHDTSVALLLLDPTRGTAAFKEVETWNKYLVKQLRERKAVKLLVGAKLDQPADTVDRTGVEQLRSGGDFASYHETSALTGRGVEDLCKAVGQAIAWEAVSRPALFQQIRDAIEACRQRGEVILYVSDLHRALGAPAASEAKEHDAIRTVVDQLAQQGVIARSRVATGEQALVLQVQEIERYAGSLVMAARNNPRGVPALELRAIAGPDFNLPGIPAQERLPRAQEKAVLECTVEMLLEHGICFAHEGLLVFPSLFAAAAPASEADNTPLPHAVSLYYDFAGAIDNIYASLVAWLVLARDFGRLRLSQDRAEFEVKAGGLCGLRKVTRPGGFAHVDVYFEDKTPPDRRAEFISFVEDHLRTQGVQIIEHVAITCPCGHDFGEETLRKRIARGDKDILCPICEKRHSLSEGAAETRKRDPKIASHLWGLKTQIEESRKDAARDAVRVLGLASTPKTATRPIRLLHLSDLHFNAETPVPARVQWLLDDLKLDSGLGVKELDYLVVSGDFTDKGCAEGFEKAYDFLSKLSAAFGLSAERCILVPGNHDVAEPLDAYARRKDSKGLRDGEWIAQGSLIMARDPEKYPLRFKPFSDDLYHKFLQRPYPMPAAQQGISIPFWDSGIQFLTLNSCWEIDEFDRKRAGIHPEAVANAIKQAQEQVEAAKTSGELAAGKKVLRIAVWHHAVTAPDYKMKDLQFLGNLQKNGVKLALHGDVHEMRRDIIGYWHDRALHVTGAGSFGARAVDRAESTPRLYNVLEIERDFSAIKIHTRRQQTPDGDWDGWPEWPDPDGGKGKVSYYTIKL